MISPSDDPGDHAQELKIPPVESAEDFERRVTAMIEPKKPNPRFGLTRFRQITLETSALYLIKGLLPAAGLVVVWGPPKCGKSFLVFDALMHIALGWDYRGHRVRRGTVAYCALEGAAGFRKRVHAFRLRFLANNPEADPSFHLMDQPLALVADHAAFVASLRAQLGEERPVVVCIDTLNRSLAGSESSDQDMSAYIKAADAVRGAFGCLVVIVHHCGHDGARPRGHSSLIGALDVQIAVRRDPAGQILAELELSKDGPVGLILASRLATIDVGVDEEGDPITSCVVEPVDAAAAPLANSPPTRKAKPPTKADSLRRAFLDAYNSLADDVKPSPGFNSHLVRKVKADAIREALKERGYLSTDDDGHLTGGARKEFHTAKTTLFDKGAFVEKDGLVWQIKAIGGQD